MQEVFMDFGENDNVIVSVKGVKGKGCKDLILELERSLGKVLKEETTAEYNQVEKKNEGAHNRR